MPLWDLAESEWELPAGRGKLSRGLLLSSPAGNVPFLTSPQLVWSPLAVPGVGLCLGSVSPCWGWVPEPHHSPGQEDTSPGREQRHQLAAFPFSKPPPGWQSLWYLRVGGDAEQAVREGSVTQNSGEFGPIPHFLPRAVQANRSVSQPTTSLCFMYKDTPAVSLLGLFSRIIHCNSP